MKKIIIAVVLVAGVASIAVASFTGNRKKAQVEKKAEKKEKKECKRSCLFS